MASGARFRQNIRMRSRSLSHLTWSEWVRLLMYDWALTAQSYTLWDLWIDVGLKLPGEYMGD